MDLPGGHVLKQNQQGEYYVVNAEKITMIEPSVIRIGHDKQWILACIRHVAIDSDERRMVFINQKNGGTVDTINRDNWENFRTNIYPELNDISLQTLQDEPCP